MKKGIKQKPRVFIVGSGYVGLPLAKSVYTTGRYDISVYTRNEDRINLLKDEFKNLRIVKNNSLSPVCTVTNSFKDVGKADIIVICVPTSVKKKNIPDFDAVFSVCKRIALCIKKGSLVILESTVGIGTSEENVIPLLSSAGKKVNRDFYFSYCPERINPGDPRWSVSNIPRVYASTSSQGEIETLRFYKSFISARLHKVASLKEAETSKILENTFRDVNIALVNEFAIVCSQLGINIQNVIKAASTKPFSFMPHYPGCGVGGECIATDPYYFIEKSRKAVKGVGLAETARNINRNMPLYCVEKMLHKMKQLKLKKKDAYVAVLGLTYKPGIDDIRNSPGLAVADILKKKKIEYVTYDPLRKDISTEKSLGKVLKKANTLIIATAHNEFAEQISENRLSDNKIAIVIDENNCLKKRSMVSFMHE